MDSVVSNSFGLDMNQVMQAMAAAKVVFEMRQREPDEKKEDSAAERSARIEESKEREKEVFEEELTEKEEARVEAFTEAMEKVMDKDEEMIKERLGDAIGILEETGIDRIPLFAEEKEEAKERIEEARELVEPKAELMREAIRILAEAGPNKDTGSGAISDRLSKIGEKDGSEFGKEMKELAKDLKDLPREEALDRVRDFISKHSAVLKVAEGLKDLIDKWDDPSLSPRKISDRLKGMVEELRRTQDRLEKGAEELKRAINVPEEFVKKAKRLFEGDNEALESIRRTWIGGVIGFIKDKAFAAEAKRDAKEREFWKGALVKAIENRGSRLEDFRKKLAETLKGRQKDFREADRRGAAAVVGLIDGMADELRRGKYADRLEGISSIADKKEMRSPLMRMYAEVGEIKRRVDAIVDKVKRGNLDGAAGIFAEPFPSYGTAGMILLKAVNKTANKAKTERIREIMKELYAPMLAYNSVIAVGKTAAKGDYERSDEMALEIRRSLGYMYKTERQLSLLLKLKNGPGRRRKIARLLAMWFRGKTPGLKGKKIR